MLNQVRSARLWFLLSCRRPIYQENGTEAFDESFVASKIVPMLANVRINRNRSYSANDVFEEEVEWAVETTNPTRADSIKYLAAEKGNAQKMERFFVLQYRETHFLDLFVLKTWKNC